MKDDKKQNSIQSTVPHHSHPKKSEHQLNRKQIRIRKRENYNQFSNKNPQRKKKKP
jgi:hypothetical protein